MKVYPVILDLISDGYHASHMTGLTSIVGSHVETSLMAIIGNCYGVTVMLKFARYFQNDSIILTFNFSTFGKIN